MNLFGWFESREKAERAVEAMASAFKTVGLESDRFVSKVGGPAARVVS